MLTSTGNGVHFNAVLIFTPLFCSSWSFRQTKITQSGSDKRQRTVRSLLSLLLRWVIHTGLVDRSGYDRRERTVRSVLNEQSVLFYHNHYDIAQKWRETKEQLIWLSDLALLGCCLISILGILVAKVREHLLISSCALPGRWRANGKKNHRLYLCRSQAC